MTKILGDFIQDLPEQEGYLVIGFLPNSLSLKKRWENNGLSADFIADYFKNFFVNKQEKSLNEEEEIEADNLRDAVKYIANELLENAMKFQDETSRFVAKIEFSFYDDKLVFCVTNAINLQQRQSFEHFIKKLLSGDPDDLYFETMRTNVQGTASGLGLLSMICDYSAKLGWKLESTTFATTIASTMVSLDL
jgi:hypothetical protein